MQTAIQRIHHPLYSICPTGSVPYGALFGFWIMNFQSEAASKFDLLADKRPTTSLHNDLHGLFDGQIRHFQAIGYWGLPSFAAPRLVVHKPASWQVDDARAGSGRLCSDAGSI